ncbi:D-methionine transport system permease protein [Proteiniborus ethanoligenes]|uniref:D-methionine transport system permease protein n=1 Tax=Proteiniborus ethanoligenes TaxID=415015 RepID=A0A1H3P7K0_9FIRM|nr:methionine ABC transporter permease [Proteiniborus ethanoligenes]SDY97020.1 D-methionine transport system permease protein [Proteiniborus ethanoligenes]
MGNIILLLLPSLWETIIMVAISTIFSLILGFPLGILLVITEKDGIWERITLNSILNGIVNIFRSFPFIILMIFIMPLTKLIVGKTIGTLATVVPLSIAAAPFVARIVESAFKEVDKGIIEAVSSMGASTFEIITKVLIPEAMPSLVLGITMTIINLIGYSAMAGAIGGGGLGDLAIRYGYHRYQTDVMIASVIVIIVLVQLIQLLGNKISYSIDKRK